MSDLEKNSTERKKVEIKPIYKSNLCVFINRRKLQVKRLLEGKIY